MFIFTHVPVVVCSDSWAALCKRRSEDEDSVDDNEAPIKEGKWRKHLNNLGYERRKNGLFGWIRRCCLRGLQTSMRTPVYKCLWIHRREKLTKSADNETKAAELKVNGVGACVFESRRAGQSQNKIWESNCKKTRCSLKSTDKHLLSVGAGYTAMKRTHGGLFWSKKAIA